MKELKQIEVQRSYNELSNLIGYLNKNLTKRQIAIIESAKEVLGQILDLEEELDKE